MLYALNICPNLRTIMPNVLNVLNKVYVADVEIQWL